MLGVSFHESAALGNFRGKKPTDKRQISIVSFSLFKILKKKMGMSWISYSEE